MKRRRGGVQSIALHNTLERAYLLADDGVHANLPKQALPLNPTPENIISLPPDAMLHPAHHCFLAAVFRPFDGNMPRAV
ncbi:hypothetical protein LMG24238_07218 [Paraburkholderia sediminicola]|uniref:Uncharacterized protein n=1 Tax=Paraburkholderia sediminicola TaxID=458836 RepID=A0A6J5CWB1_9BURK|nr:hypothetical protein [Paraburkholderia sediminicola]CAB3744135.1 hypothetical protein LMG24238_07218 [Paraburkholderia sediminicola]